MIKWLKDLFKPSDSGRMVPISQIEADQACEKREEQKIQDEMLDIESQIAEYDELNKEVREYVYMGNGMMEEVIRIVPKEEHLQANTRRTVELNRSASTSSGYTPSYSPIVYAGSDYVSDSGYSSCDGGSSPGGCD